MPEAHKSPQASFKVQWILLRKLGTSQWGCNSTNATQIEVNIQNIKLEWQKRDEGLWPRKVCGERHGEGHSPK